MLALLLGERQQPVRVLPALREVEALPLPVAEPRVEEHARDGRGASKYFLLLAAQTGRDWRTAGRRADRGWRRRLAAAGSARRRWRRRWGSSARSSGSSRVLEDFRALEEAGQSTTVLRTRSLTVLEFQSGQVVLGRRRVKIDCLLITLAGLISRNGELGAQPALRERGGSGWWRRWCAGRTDGLARLDDGSWRRLLLLLPGLKQQRMQLEDARRVLAQDIVVLLQHILALLHVGQRLEAVNTLREEQDCRRVVAGLVLTLALLQECERLVPECGRALRLEL